MSDNDQQERRGPITPEELSVRGPGGMGFTFKGQSQQLLVILLIIVLTGALAYLQWQHSQDEALHAVNLAASQERIEKHLIAADETTQALIYVISLSEADRARLNLARPKKLSELQR